MKEYYIYLTILHHPTLGDLYYAGKHKSEGPEKDKKYHGSCRYVHWEKWIKTYPVQTRILQWFDTVEEESAAETDLIIKCLTKHGAFLQDIWLSDGTHRSWLDVFGKGTCLNGHWQNMDQCHIPEIIEKQKQSRINNGTYQKCIDVMHTPEATAKAQKTRDENGTTQRSLDIVHTREIWDKAQQTRRESGGLDSWVKATHTSDVTARQQKTREENGSFQKMCDASHTIEAETKRSITRNKVFRYEYNGETIYIGKSFAATRRMRNRNQAWIKKEEILQD